MTFMPLVPSHASPHRRAVEEASSLAFDIDFAIEALDNPGLAPEQFLPFLAWGLSTDLWDRSWPLEKKRAVVGGWFFLHQKKGTLAGIREALRFFDARLVNVRRPPDAFYPGGSQTREEREAYLARFRQLRVYPYRNRGTARPNGFIGKVFLSPSSIFPVRSDARLRIGRRAFVYDPRTGEETQVTKLDRVIENETRTAVSFEQAMLPGESGNTFFVGRFLGTGRTFLSKLKTEARVYSFTVDQTYVESTESLRLTSTLPSAQPIDVRPRRVALQGTRRRSQLFPGSIGEKRSFLSGIHLPESTARLRMFDQIFLHEADRLPQRRQPGRAFAGNIRLGMAPFNARLTVEIRGKRPKRAFGKFVGGYLSAPNRSQVAQALDATRRSKALRDKVLINTKTLRTINVNDGVKLGQYKVGALVRDI